MNMARKQNQGTVSHLVVPPAFDHYNKRMGDVDQVDQIRTSDYGIDSIGRAMKWTVRLYEALFNLCLANAYRAYRHLRSLEGQSVDHFDFNASVAKRMLEIPTYAVERTPTFCRKEQDRMPIAIAGQSQLKIKSENCCCSIPYASSLQAPIGKT